MNDAALEGRTVRKAEDEERGIGQSLLEALRTEVSESKTSGRESHSTPLSVFDRPHVEERCQATAVHIDPLRRAQFNFSG